MKTDGRQLHRKALNTIRALALQRIAAGETVTAVMQSDDLCRTSVYTAASSSPASDPRARIFRSPGNAPPS